MTADEIIARRREYEPILIAQNVAMVEFLQREFLDPILERMFKLIERQELHERVVKFFRKHSR